MDLQNADNTNIKYPDYEIIEVSGIKSNTKHRDTYGDIEFHLPKFLPSIMAFKVQIYSFAYNIEKITVEYVNGTLYEAGALCNNTINTYEATKTKILNIDEWFTIHPNGGVTEIHPYYMMIIRLWISGIPKFIDSESILLSVFYADIKPVKLQKIVEECSNYRKPIHYGSGILIKNVSSQDIKYITTNPDRITKTFDYEELYSEQRWTEFCNFINCNKNRNKRKCIILQNIDKIQKYELLETLVENLSEYKLLLILDFKENKEDKKELVDRLPEIWKLRIYEY